VAGAWRARRIIKSVLGGPAPDADSVGAALRSAVGALYSLPTVKQAAGGRADALAAIRPPDRSSAAVLSGQQPYQQLGRGRRGSSSGLRATRATQSARGRQASTDGVGGTQAGVSDPTHWGAVDPNHRLALGKRPPQRLNVSRGGGAKVIVNFGWLGRAQTYL
jgi:hypothetical protein